MSEVQGPCHSQEQGKPTIVVTVGEGAALLQKRLLNNGDF